MFPAKALSSRCTSLPDPDLPNPSMEGPLPATRLFQLSNHQSYPTTTETSTRYTMILQKRRKARLQGGKELWMKEIFSSYAIDFMGPFTKLKGQDSVLVVVDRAVGFSWLIPTSVTATAVQTTELPKAPYFYASRSTYLDCQ